MSTYVLCEKSWANNLIDGRIYRLAPGIYADSNADHTLIVHLGEVIESRELDDTQECRASIYGSWQRFCQGMKIVLYLVHEPDAPSVHEG